MNRGETISIRNRVIRGFALSVLPIFCASACSSAESSSPTADLATTTTILATTTTTRPEYSTDMTKPRRDPLPIESQGGLTFEIKPQQNFSVADCNRDPNNWAVRIDSKPTDQDRLAVTIGAAESFDSQGHPTFLLGAIVQGIGEYKYKVATSSDPDQEILIDLNDEPYAEILNGEPGKYDAVFTARDGKDGRAYFKINCLPNFEFFGDREPPVAEQVPLPLPPPVPTSGPTIQTASLIVR